MKNLEHITAQTITHTCETFYEHLPKERRESIKRVFGIKESTLQKRAARHSERRPMTAPELLAGLITEELDETFLDDLLSITPYGAHRMDGKEVCLMTSIKNGAALVNEKTKWAENGQFEQFEKRAGKKTIRRRISELIGLHKFMERTENRKTPAWISE